MVKKSKAPARAKSKKSRKATPDDLRRTSSDLRVVSTKLFRADVDLLQRRSDDTGVPWQTQLRALVHANLTGPKLRAYKFVVPPDQQRAVAPGVSYAGCAAVVLARSTPEALALLRRLAVEDGLDARWLDVADVTEIPLDEARRIVWAIT